MYVYTAMMTKSMVCQAKTTKKKQAMMTSRHWRYAQEQEVRQLFPFPPGKRQGRWVVCSKGHQDTILF